MKKACCIILLIPALVCSSCSFPSNFQDNLGDTAEPPQTAVTSEPVMETEPAPESVPVSVPETEAQTILSEGADSYHFDRTIDFVELDDKFYYCYTHKLIRFDNVEIPYEEFLSYKSPYDEYVTMFYDDRSGEFGVADTVAFAIRYAYENDIEYLDFPIEYGTQVLAHAWEYARLTFPNLPLETANSDFDISEDGRYRIHLTNALRKIAGSEEPLRVAKEIVSDMPASCKTDAQKAYYLYDWICQNVVYDEYHTQRREGKVNGTPQSAYGALIEKRAVCDGIAGALQLLFSIAGIECGKVDAYDYVDGMGHVWNVAEIDGELWDFDATWDIHRFYEKADDTITTDVDAGYYEWFGVERTAKTVELDINDMISESGSFTEYEYTANSPASLSYDFVINTDPETYEETYYANGKQIDDIDFDQIFEKLDNGECVAFKFNDSLTLADYWSFFTDSEAALIDYEVFSGYPDTELLKIEVYPADYYD